MNLDILDSLKANQKPDSKNFDGQFEPIIPFDNFDTPELPASLLPPALGEYVSNIAEVLKVPVAMPFMGALGMVSASLAKKFVVSPKADWAEPLNIYTLTAMPPASNKSQTLKMLKAPIDEWEKIERERIAPERNQALADLRILEIEQKKQSKIIGNKSAKQADIDKAKDALKEIEEKIAVKKDSIPVIPQIYTNDATPEAIADMVHEQKGRLAIISDEGGITEVLAGLYNNGNANIDIFLKGIDGGATRIRRAHKDYQLNPYLTVLLFIQPQILANMADKRAFDGNGALERYLYTVPHCNVGYRVFDNAVIDGMVKTRYENLIINLLHIPMPETPYKLDLDFPAQKAFESFREEIERELRPDGRLYICRGWGGKIAGYTLRLAGLMHMAEHNSANHLLIENKTMNNAIQLAHLLIDHTLAAYGIMGADREVSDAKELLEWLKTQNTKSLAKSQIINAMRNRKMGVKERLNKAIAVLMDRNILSAVHRDYETRKPTDIYFINPAIYN